MSRSLDIIKQIASLQTELDLILDEEYRNNRLAINSHARLKQAEQKARNKHDPMYQIDPDYGFDVGF